MAQAIDYNINDAEAAPATANDFDGETAEVLATDISPVKIRRRKAYEDSDTDFQPEEDNKEQSADEMEDVAPDNPNDLSPQKALAPRGLASNEVVSPQSRPKSSQQAQPEPKAKIHQNNHPKSSQKAFKRARVQPPRLPQPYPPSTDRVAVDGHADDDNDTTTPSYSPPPPVVMCPACGRTHHQGSCPLKIAGAETCNLCGLAHFGTGRTCPHINSETQVLLMIEAIKQSREPPHLKEAATRYLRGVKGTLVQAKKKHKEKTEMEKAIAAHNAKTGVGRTNGVEALRQTSGNANARSAAGSRGRTPQGFATPNGHNTTNDVEHRLFAALGPGAPQDSR